MIEQFPETCVIPDGRIGIFLGGGYRYLTQEQAEAFASEILKRVKESKERAA